MLDLYTAILPTPFGALGLQRRGEHISRLDFLPPGTPTRAPHTALEREALAQLQAWLTCPSHAFDLPLAPAGTAFQQRVWHAICAIPVGHTLTYGTLAQQLQSSARAMGQACGANPYPIIVPCHRVVGTRSPGGFAHARSGFLMHTKHWLLQHECAS